MARLKMGSFTGFTSKDGTDIMTGDEVRHSVTGVTGVVNMYGSVVNTDGSGTNRLSNDIWEVTKPYVAKQIGNAVTPASSEDQEEKSLRVQLYDTKCLLRNAEIESKTLSAECERLRERLKQSQETLDEYKRKAETATTGFDSLDWSDIRIIVNTADGLLEDLDKKTLMKMGEEGYYSLVLNTYWKQKPISIDPEAVIKALNEE